MLDAGEQRGFAGLLRQHRLAAGLTQESLAERTGLGTRTIQGLEGGEARPRRATIERLARELPLTGDERARLLDAARPAPRARRAGHLAPTRPPDEPPRRHPAAGQLGLVPEAGPDGDRVDRAPARVPNNLPLQLTSFVGREREIDEVGRLLTASRLVTLTGTGGVGKTRLALQVAAEQVAAYPDGVWFVELAPLADEQMVPQAVLVALRLREAPGRPPLAILTEHLRARDLLVVLDNCEHLVQAAAELSAALLAAGPAVRILATSRERLGVTGEIAWRVPSLPTPDPSRAQPLEAVVRYAGVRLFADRARAVDRGWALTAANAPAVAEVCRRLDGLPLAIELAAARVLVLTVEQIADRLGDRFRLLTGGSRTALPRHRTLRALVDWSHELLTEPERILLRRLSVFAGGWTLPAAEALWGSGEGRPGEPTLARDDARSLVTAAVRPAPDPVRAVPNPGPEVLDLLDGLVQKSLVVAVDHAAEVRYRLPETIRQYAAERLRVADEATWARDRHLDWCVAWAEQAAAPEASGSWSRRFATELDNLRSALAWSRAAGRGAAQLRLAAALARFWYRTRRYDAEARVRLREALDGPDTPPGPARVAVLAQAGRFEAEHGDAPRGEALGHEAVAVCRRIGDWRLLAWALRLVGVTVLRGGDARAARALFEQALAAARQAAAGREIAYALLLLAEVERRDGDLLAARRRLDDALVAARDANLTRLTLNALIGLARMAAEVGCDERARSLIAEARAAISTADDDSRRQSLAALGDVARLRGDERTAEALYRESLAPALRVHPDIETAATLVRYARLERGRGRLARATRLLGAEHAWRAGVGSPRVRAAVRRDYDDDLALLRTSLGEEAFAVAWAAGRAMTIDQAIEYALGDAE